MLCSAVCVELVTIFSAVVMAEGVQVAGLPVLEESRDVVCSSVINILCVEGDAVKKQKNSIDPPLSIST